MSLNLPWTPTFLFGDGDSLALTYPVTRSIPGGRTEGRVLHTVTGALGVSLRLRKYLLTFALRFTEAEWPSVRDFVASVQTDPGSFTWEMNAQNPDVVDTVEVWWEAPHVAEAIKPVRDSIYPNLFTLTLTVSRMTAPWDVEYFRLPAD